MIRKYNDNDLKILLDIWYSASLMAHPFLDDTFLQQERENIINIYLPNTETWVYELKSKVIGFVALSDNEVGALFVHPHYHHKGYGSALMDHAKSLHTKLYVEVFKDNHIGRNFYKKYGFVLQKEYFHKESRHYMQRLLFIS